MRGTKTTDQSLGAVGKFMSINNLIYFVHSSLFILLDLGEGHPSGHTDIPFPKPAEAKEYRRILRRQFFYLF